MPVLKIERNSANFLSMGQLAIQNEKTTAGTEVGPPNLRAPVQVQEISPAV
jgi:hypothetical protein